MKRGTAGSCAANIRAIQHSGVDDLRKVDEQAVPHAAWLLFARPTNGHKPPAMAPATIREVLSLPPPWCFKLSSGRGDRSAKRFNTWPKPETLRELEMIQDSPLERTR